MMPPGVPGVTAALYKSKGMKHPPEHGPLAAVTPSGLPVIAIQRLPCSGGFCARCALDLSGADTASSNTESRDADIFKRQRILILRSCLYLCFKRDFRLTGPVTDVAYTKPVQIKDACFHRVSGGLNLAVRLERTVRGANPQPRRVSDD